MRSRSRVGVGKPSLDIPWGSVCAENLRRLLEGDTSFVRGKIEIAVVDVKMSTSVEQCKQVVQQFKTAMHASTVQYKVCISPSSPFPPFLNSGLCHVLHVSR